MHFSITEQFKGVEKIILAGDEFVRKSGKNLYLTQKPCFGMQRYSVEIAATDKYNNNNPFLIGRLLNTVIKALNKCENMPKMIFLITEDDIVNDIKTTDRSEANAIFEKYIHYLITEVEKVIDHFRDLLPENAKRVGWPKVIFIQPTIHRNYEYVNQRLRQQLAEVFEKSITKKDMFWALKLLQVWDKNNLNIARAETQKITNDGLAIFWKAIDRTVRFCDKCMLRAEANLDNNPFVKDKEDRRRLPTPPPTQYEKYSNRTWTRPGYNRY